MTLTGRCHCGAIHYQVAGQPAHHALCHCGDCRRHAGAPVVAWAAFPAAAVSIQGEPRTYASSEQGRRQFCGECGTGLFYVNEAALPGLIDIQSATLDDPDALPPQAQIQVAERIGWMERIDDLPKFARFPGQD